MVYNFEEFYVETINDFVGGFGSAPTAGGSASRLLILSLVCYTDAWLLIYIYTYIYMYICRESERERERDYMTDIITIHYYGFVHHCIVSYYIRPRRPRRPRRRAARRAWFVWLVGWLVWLVLLFIFLSLLFILQCFVIDITAVCCFGGKASAAELAEA